MQPTGQRGDPRFGYAWLTFGAALILHVADEATHDFLSVYNPNARAIRARFPFIPIPTFTFNEFVLSLGLAILLLLCLSPFAFAGSPRMKAIAVPLSIVVGFGNGLLHLGSSLYFSRWMPGSYSSPILILAGLFLLTSARRRSQRANLQAAGL